MQSSASPLLSQLHLFWESELVSTAVPEDVEASPRMFNEN